MRPRENLLYGETWLETPDPVRSPKPRNHGGPPGNRTYSTDPKSDGMTFIFGGVRLLPFRVRVLGLGLSRVYIVFVIRFSNHLVDVFKTSDRCFIFFNHLM